MGHLGPFAEQRSATLCGHLRAQRGHGRSRAPLGPVGSAATAARACASSHPGGACGPVCTDGRHCPGAGQGAAN
eukprot:2002930-Lingulodinium_polyedra.AAC.1